MTSFASFTAALLSQAWSAMLVFMAAVAIVLALRLPCRRLFGAGRALQLWSLVPLMLLTAAWPRMPGATASRLPPVVVRIVTAPAALSAPIAVTASVDWRTLLLAGWAAGVLMMLARAVVTQARFRRQLAGARRVGARATDGRCGAQRGRMLALRW
ncbi:MAG: M56 family metallopeptidase [Dyella sp.]|uniref:M56 family metallopeptidase n=1 Tax=Dyella sp. TaxID=1869338 RepID=UPI003F8047BE